LPLPKPLPVPIFKATHQAGELLIKFKASAPVTLQEEVRTNYGSDAARFLSGRAGVERLSLKAGVDVATAISELPQLTAVVEWVEPNYLVQVARWKEGEKGRTGAREKGRKAPRAAITVAVIDTGIAAAHPRLQAHLSKTGGWNFVNDTATSSDDNGHGTQMAGIITRVHPQARLLPLKALDAEGIGSIAAVVAAMDAAVAAHAQVILYSFGTEGKSNALLEAIQRAERAGVVVVTAAGNDSQDLARVPQYPAAFDAPNLVTVAAVNAQRELADFSNYGQAAQVAAPGVEIRTTTHPNRFTRISGTSASAAHVAGVASRLKAVRPWVSAATIKQSLMQGARKLPALTGKVSAGVVDAKGALTAMQNPKSAAKDDKKDSADQQATGSAQTEFQEP
jgi:subtilisin family serine protease